MKNVLIRCDASLEIGTGHVIRCKNLGNELKLRGFNVIFFCRETVGNFINFLEEDFQVVNIKNICSTNFQDNQNNWLNTSQESDCNEFLNQICKLRIKKIEWVVIDHYGLDHKWENYFIKELSKRNIQNFKPKIFVIDDLANRKHNCDYLLDQTTFRYGSSRYEKLVPKDCILLMGHEYVILGKEYSTYRMCIPKRNKLERILIFFGGSDPDDNTLKTIKLIKKSNFANKSFDIVVGKNYKGLKLLKDNLKGSDNFRIHIQLKSLAELILKADLSIGSGGLVMWERLCLCLPSIVIPIAENQVNVSKYISELGLITFFENFNNFSKNINSLEHYFHKGKNAIKKSSIKWDGLGISRICKIFDY